MTPKQAKLYRYLLDRIDNPVCPTLTEISDAMGLAGKSGAHRLLNALEEQGLIERRANRSRQVRAIRRSPFDGITSAAMIAELKRRGDLI